MKIDTPEKYKALQKRRRRVKKSTLKDRIESIEARNGLGALVKNKETGIYSVIRLPQQIGHGMKPEHHKRALTSGFAPLMTRAIVPQGWFTQMSKKVRKSL